MKLDMSAACLSVPYLTGKFRIVTPLGASGRVIVALGSGETITLSEAMVVDSRPPLRKLKAGDIATILYHPQAAGTLAPSPAAPRPTFAPPRTPRAHYVSMRPDERDACADPLDGVSAATLLEPLPPLVHLPPDATSIPWEAREVVIEDLLATADVTTAAHVALQLATGGTALQVSQVRFKDILWSGLPHTSEMSVVCRVGQHNVPRLFVVTGAARTAIELLWGMFGGLHARPDAALPGPGAPQMQKALLGAAGTLGRTSVGAVPSPAALAPLRESEIATLPWPPASRHVALDRLDPQRVSWRVAGGVVYVLEGGVWRPLGYASTGWTAGHSDLSPWRRGMFAEEVIAAQPPYWLLSYESTFNACNE